MLNVIITVLFIVSNIINSNATLLDNFTDRDPGPHQLLSGTGYPIQRSINHSELNTLSSEGCKITHQLKLSYMHGHGFNEDALILSGINPYLELQFRFIPTGINATCDIMIKNLCTLVDEPSLIFN